MIKTIQTKFRLFSIALFLCSSSYAVQSQNSHFGIIGGMNISNLDEGRYDNYDFFLPGVGLSIGVTYDFKIISNFEINLEALVSKKIIKEKYFVEDGNIYDYSISDFRINNTYLSIPVTFNYSLDRLGIQAGIFTDILLKNSTSGKNINTELSNIDYKMAYDGGFVFGGHYDFYNLEIGLRKYIGIVNQSKITIEEEYIQNMISLYKSSLLQFYIKYNL